MPRVNKEKKRLVDSLREQARDEATLRASMPRGEGSQKAIEDSQARSNAIWDKLRALGL